MAQSQTGIFSRRETLAFLGAFAGQSLITTGTAHAAEPNDQLPLHTSGLEHLGMTVPDPEATARFYGKIFDPQLFQEKDPPPRFYVRLGKAYIAFGGNAAATPKIDHFCALVEGYKPQEMRKALEEVGITMGASPLAMPTDSDGIRLQLLGVPGGMARTIIPATRISQDDAALQAIGFDHIILTVSDLEKSAAYYGKFFGKESARTRKPERIWFDVAKTKLGLEAVTAGKQPSINHVSVRIAGFDKKTATEKLRKVGAEISPSNDEGLLRFRDPNGIMLELKAGA